MSDGDASHAASLAREGGRPCDASGRTSGSGRTSATPPATLARGIRALAALPGVRLRAVSRLYATRPVGVVDQPPFRNAVVALDVPGRPRSGDRRDRAARSRSSSSSARSAAQERERWGPRELDLDLLVFGRARLSLERPPEGLSLDPGKADRLLVVPHREAAERLFVLAPLADLAAGLMPPGWRETVATAAARAGSSRRARTPSARSRRGTRPRSQKLGERPDVDERVSGRLPRNRIGSAVSVAPPAPSGSTRQAPAAGADVTTSTSSRSRKTSAAPSSTA